MNMDSDVIDSHAIPLWVTAQGKCQCGASGQLFLHHPREECRAIFPAPRETSHPLPLPVSSPQQGCSHRAWRSQRIPEGWQTAGGRWDAGKEEEGSAQPWPAEPGAKVSRTVPFPVGMILAQSKDPNAMECCVEHCFLPVPSTQPSWSSFLVAGLVAVVWGFLPWQWPGLGHLAPLPPAGRGSRWNGAAGERRDTHPPTSMEQLSSAGPTPLKGPHGRCQPTPKHLLNPLPRPTPLCPAPAAGSAHCGEPVTAGNSHPAALTQPTPASGCSGTFRVPPAAGTTLGAASRSIGCLRTRGEPASQGAAPLPAPTARPCSQHRPHGSRIRSTQQLPAHAQQIPPNPTRNPKPGKRGGGCQAEGCQARG